MPNASRLHTTKLRIHLARYLQIFSTLLLLETYFRLPTLHTFRSRSVESEFSEQIAALARIRFHARGLCCLGFFSEIRLQMKHREHDRWRRRRQRAWRRQQFAAMPGASGLQAARSPGASRTVQLRASCGSAEDWMASRSRTRPIASEPLHARELAADPRREAGRDTAPPGIASCCAAPCASVLSPGISGRHRRVRRLASSRSATIARAVMSREGMSHGGFQHRRTA